jgi:hypothetical protein
MDIGSILKIPNIIKSMRKDIRDFGSGPPKCRRHWGKELKKNLLKQMNIRDWGAYPLGRFMNGFHSKRVV